MKSVLLKDNLLPRLDRPLSALIENLGTKGVLDSTLVYGAGEFGRTPKINKGAGCDHWARSMAVVLAGGGIAHGSTGAQGMVPADAPCSPDAVSATIFHCLGIDQHHELTTATGRPMNVFREGKVLAKLVG